MTNFKKLALGAFLASVTVSNGFTTGPTIPNGHLSKGKVSSTELFIIGPMIRKMREEEAKKRMPMASEDERKTEAPGLRVGAGAWKWPPIWPYDDDSFVRSEEIKQKGVAPASFSGMLTGNNPMNGLPRADSVVNGDENKEADNSIEVLDLMKYWGEEKATITTDLDKEASESLRSHYSYYLRDGMSVLEFGAAEESYLPSDLKLERHVGVGLSKPLMDQNSFLTEKLVVDLNKVVEEEGVDSDELKALGSNTFDVVIMANTLDFLTSPREVFRTAWYLLKPGGLMMVPFTNKEAYKSKFERAQTKIWRDMTDDQHMWIAGSVFQFSAGDGWEGLKGFDITPENARREEGIMSVMNSSKGNCMFVVQATKANEDISLDSEDPTNFFASKMWMLPTLELRDKKLLAPRLARSYKFLGGENEKDALIQNVETLPKVYEALVKMDQFSFPFSMQAQLATDLATDSDFQANDEQMKALKMGLGLRTPSASFWEPVGRLTGAMAPEDKVNLLAYIVPRFGSGNPEQEIALQNFIDGLEPTFSVIRSKCTTMTEADVQLLGTELLAAEILKPGVSTKEEYAMWIASLTENEMKAILERRKKFKEDAVSDMKFMQGERKAKADRIAALRAKMEKQREEAKENRTMRFNVETGKVEEVK